VGLFKSKDEKIREAAIQQEKREIEQVLPNSYTINEAANFLARLLGKFNPLFSTDFPSPMLIRPYKKGVSLIWNSPNSPNGILKIDFENYLPGLVIREPDDSPFTYTTLTKPIRRRHCPYTWVKEELTKFTLVFKGNSGEFQANLIHSGLRKKLHSEGANKGVEASRKEFKEVTLSKIKQALQKQAIALEWFSANKAKLPFPEKELLSFKIERGYFQSKDPNPKLKFNELTGEYIYD